MAQSEPDERLVYLACQHIFRGANSHVRKRKSVHKLIQQNKPALADLLREHNIERTCNVAKRLLDNKIFDSNLNAKIRFPELFDVSPAQSAEREASEVEAARDEANALREISEKEGSKEIIIKPQVPAIKERIEEVDAASKTRTGVENPVSTLYPVYLHYRSQHIITTSIQKLVEEGCFAYAQKHFPDLLARKGWNCPEAGELTEWTKLLPHYISSLLTTNKPREELFGYLCELRHSAVHRLHKTAIGVERLVENAQLFLELLDDCDRAERVSKLRRELSLAIEEIKRNKDLLEGRYLAEMKEIQRQRAALEVRERNARSVMVEDDLQCLDEIGHGLERAVQSFSIAFEEKGDIKGKGRMPAAYPELSDSEEEFFESGIADGAIAECSYKHL